MLFLVWAEYTRLSKEVGSAAFLSMRREALNRELAGRHDELNAALDELTEAMASFESARDPDDLAS